MHDHLGIIEKINTECKSLFSQSFKLIPYSGHHNISIFRIEGTSLGLNRIDEDPVKLLKWFHNFWLFIEVKFIKEEFKVIQKIHYKIHINISLSIYEGEDADDSKIQLFRAEWDDMNNAEEKHSQPHWHITSSQALEKSFEDYSTHFDNGDFLALLEEAKANIFDVKRIHFAMNGNWQNDQHHVHPIKSPDIVSKWLRGILNHIRTELDSD